MGSVGVQLMQGGQRNKQKVSRLGRQIVLPGGDRVIQPVWTKTEVGREDISVFYCYCNKLAQSWWLKTAQMYYLKILKVRSLTGSHWATIKEPAGLYCSPEALG